MADELLDERVPRPPDPDQRRVLARASALRRTMRLEPREAVRAARALLRDSHARTVDPAASVRDERVERRTSEDATPPAIGP